MAFHQIVLLVGRKKCGKTTLCDQLLKSKSRVLVIDTYDHPAYRSFKTVPGDSVTKIKSGKYRTFDKQPIEVLKDVFYKMYDLTLVMEDAPKYLEASVPKDIKAGFIDNRNRGIDIILMFHALRDVPPYVARMYNTLILFKTNEKIEYSKDKFSNYEEIEAAHRELMNDPSDHCRKIIRLNE